MIVIEASVEGGTIQLLGGDPRGGCALHKALTKEAGWRRAGIRGVTLASGAPCSVFQAPLYPSTARAAERLQETYDVLILDQDLDRLRQVRRSLSEAKEVLKSPPTGLLYAPPGRKLHPHQIQAVEASRLMGYKCMIADDMGLGKTTVALAAFHQSRAKRMLVVCPASVKHNWFREARAVLGEEPYIHLISGTRKRREKVLLEMDQYQEHGGVAIINYDLLPHLSGGPAECLKSWAHDQMVVLDESHYIKSKEAQRTKWVREHLKGANYRLALTGTPVRNMIDDLYCQADFIRPGMWSSYSDFCRRYLIQVRITMGNRSFFQPKGTKNHAELNRLVNTFQIRRSKEEAFNLPPKVRTVTTLELDDSTRRIYKAMREFALLDLAQLDQGAPMFQPKAASAVDAAIRCEQIAQGFVGGIPEGYREKVLPLLVDHAETIPGRPGELIFPKSTKIRWVMETIESIIIQGGAPVVFSKYNGPLFWMAEQLDGFGLLHGGVSSEERDRQIQAFHNGELRGMLCQVKISEGFNLTRSHDVIFLGRDWSPAVNAQAEDRCHRIGTTGTVNIQIPVVTGTIEDHITKRLELKADEAERAIRNLTVGELREIL